MRSIIKSILVLCFTTGIFAQQHTDPRNLRDGLALHGYDPVAYFEQGKALKGKQEFAVHVGAAVYYCSSLSNKKTMLARPAVYEPEYGGWCAYAMGDSGEKVSIDPETFKILEGKLYLFYHTPLINTLKKWNKDEKDLHRQADLNWASIQKQSIQHNEN